MYNCTKVDACGHKFCQYCISKFRDCPLCGVDINSTSADKDTDDMVQKFLEVHAGNPALWTKMVGMPPSQDTSKAGFYLLLGMQSLAGGNLDAARSRLQACKDDLQQQLEAASGLPAQQQVELCIRTGAVCGSLADCSRRAGDQEHAAALYQEAIELLEPHSGSGEEAVHTLAVTHNKLGDLLYSQGDAAGARQCYVRGLSVRQQALEAGAGSEEGGEQLKLDLAVSAIKVADASKVLGDSSAVSKFCGKARELLQQLQGRQQDEGGATTARCQQLQALLDSEFGEAA